MTLLTDTVYYFRVDASTALPVWASVRGVNGTLKNVPNPLIFASWNQLPQANNADVTVCNQYYCDLVNSINFNVSGVCSSNSSPFFFAPAHPLTHSSNYKSISYLSRIKLGTLVFKTQTLFSQMVPLQESGLIPSVLLDVPIMENVLPLVIKLDSVIVLMDLLE